MGYYNVPNDWNRYYYSCGCHASEGGCSCPEVILEQAQRKRLLDSGYTIDVGGIWTKCILVSHHKCRRDHKDGSIKKGEYYKLKVYREICDEDGSSWHYKKKTKLRTKAY